MKKLNLLIISLLLCLNFKTSFTMEKTNPITEEQTCGWKNIHVAALKDFCLSLENFLNEGIDIETKTKDQYGWTPLHIAIIANNPKAIEVLLKNGANVDAIDKNGMTPSHIALLHKKTEIFEKILLKYNPNLNIRDFLHNWTPLDIKLAKTL